MESIPHQTIERLKNIAAGAAEPLRLLILRLTARGTPSRPIIEVILDGPRLISIDDCQAVSKKLHDAIEADQTFIKGNYRLDVLSPGLDEPIVHDYQFTRSIGHLVEVIYDDKNITGILKSFSPDDIILTKRQSKRSGKKEAGEAEEIRIERAKVKKVFARADFK